MDQIKKAVHAVADFFRKCFIRFRKQKKNRLEDSPDETRVFNSLDNTEQNGHAAKKPKIRYSRPHELPYISKEHLSGEGKEHIDMFTFRRHNNNFVIGIILTTVKLFIIAIFIFCATGFGTLVGIAKAYMDTTPKLDTAEIENQAQTSYIYDCNNKQITPYTGTENRDWASIDEIPLQLQNAFIAIEDVRFYYHSGVDFKRLVSVFFSNLMNSNVQGGSTITQQLIKNSLLTSVRTYKRKIQEAYLAIQLEQKYTKKQILAAYLNTIPMGGTDYGVKAAAMDYFGKNPSQLTLRECAMLASITQSPTQYNPRRCYYVTKNTTALNNRINDVLKKMYMANFITKDQYDSALNDNVNVLEKSSVNKMYEYPYFVEYAISDVITHMLSKENLTDTDVNRATIDEQLRTGGYKIYLSVDPTVQKTVEDTLANFTKYPKTQNSSDSVAHYENSDGSTTDVRQPQSAAVVIDQSTGLIKALVGGRDEPTVKKSLNRAYQATMPVGSSIKPIAVYGPALDMGCSDGTVVPNLPLPITGWDSTNGYPASDDYGPVTLRSAIVHSLNSATAYTLMDLVGMKNSYNYLVNMGINPSHIEETGSGLALGTSGITPVEMAGAYATIADGGIYQEPLSFTKVVDKNGNVVLDASKIQGKRRVFKESTAWLLTSMLEDAVQYGTGKKAQIKGMNVGGKTGTNQNVKGIFFAGITPYYTSTVWIGSDKFKSLDNSVYSSEYAAPLWQAYMSKILEGKDNKDIIQADPDSLGLVKRRVCSVSGLLATDACEHDTDHPPVDAWFVKGTEPTENCNLHQAVTICSASGKLASKFCPDSGKKSVSALFLPSDSVYLKLTSDQLAKYGLHYVFPAPDGFDVNSLTPDDPAFGTYFCNVHTQDWYNNQQSLVTAISAAKDQISASQGVLSDSSLSMSMDDHNSLSAKITELQTLISSADATTGAVEQKTSELKTLTENLKALYSGR